jgi:hypothetical protein
MLPWQMFVKNLAMPYSVSYGVLRTYRVLLSYVCAAEGVGAQVAIPLFEQTKLPIGGQQHAACLLPRCKVTTMYYY